MIAVDEKPGATGTCAVEISPAPVDAGGLLTLAVSVTTTPPGDLRGRELVLRDGDGAEVGRAAFVDFDGLTSGTGRFEVPAPRVPGAYLWTAAAPLDPSGEAELTAPVEVEVRAHATSLLVWDVPATVEPGARFRVKLGSKCSSGCGLAGRAVEILDGAGTVVATAAFGAEPWPRTALYGVEVELVAPDAPGLQQWQARTLASDADLPHTAGAASFPVRVVAAADCALDVTVIDRDRRTPIKGATVVLHPYRATTDASGVAAVRLPRGDYTLFVSGPRYFPYRAPLTLDADLALTTELVVEPPIERN